MGGLGGEEPLGGTISGIVTEIEHAVFSVLIASADLYALVGNHIYPLTIPQEATLPFISFFRESGLRHHAMGVDCDLVESRIEMSVWANSLTSMRVIIDLIKGLFQRWRGTYDTVVVKDSLIETEYDDFDETSESYRSVITFQIFHT